MPEPSCAVCGAIVDDMANCTEDMAHETGWRTCKACGGDGLIHERPTAWDVIGETPPKSRRCVGCGGEGLHPDEHYSGIPKPRRVVLTRAQRLEGMPTGRLMGLLRSSRFPGYDEYANLGPEPDFTADEIKAVLATRPHVPNKKEAKKIRQEAAKRGR